MTGTQTAFFLQQVAGAARALRLSLPAYFSDDECVSVAQAYESYAQWNLVVRNGPHTLENWSSETDMPSIETGAKKVVRARAKVTKCRTAGSSGPCLPRAR